MAVLSQAGVTTIGPGKEQQHVPWTAVASVRQSSFDGSVHFQDEQGRKLLSLDPEFLGARRRMHQFVEAPKRRHEETTQG